MKLFGKKKEKENVEDDLLDPFFEDFNKLEEVSEKKTKKVERRVSISVNKFKIFTLIVEIFLIVYLILSLMKIVPFF